MPDWLVHDVDANVRARVVRDAPAIPAALEPEIEALWAAAQARTGSSLFNGRVFSVDAITPGLLSGHFTEFRQVVAQMDRPDLFGILQLRPLAVCGVLWCREGIVFGRRPARAVYQPAMWQLPPAGSVDERARRPDGSLDLRGQLFAELSEELGLSRDSIGECRPLCMVEHPGSHVLDLGFLLRTPLSAEAVLAAHKRRSDGEYPDLEVVAFEDVRTRVNALGDAIVPPAIVFLRGLGLVAD